MPPSGPWPTPPALPLRLDSIEFSSLYSTKLNSILWHGPASRLHRKGPKPKCDRKGGPYAKDDRCSVCRRRFGVGFGVLCRRASAGQAADIVLGRLGPGKRLGG